ncbi:hypothetical protein DFH05DRAFT_95736 [Lentinula detonsa]|uniref:Uncharacterized protein n=1 Tax=Lentinula detonsa TaxID=2804962 RepID=A0A9W8U353_9AGAR|nr:hypothetical protein DFH05DRAFT_95736 [Lentinula detonsa]
MSHTDDTTTSKHPLSYSSSSSTLFQPKPIRSPTYPLATYGPYPNVYSPFSTRSGPPSPSPYGYTSHRSPQHSPHNSPPASRSGSRKSSCSPISRSPSHSELSRNSSYRSNMNYTTFRPISIMSKKNSNYNVNEDGVGNGNATVGTSSREVGLEIGGERQRTGNSGSSGSSGGATSSTRISPISDSAADATAAGEVASNPTNGGKPVRKGKAVQWLDHHLNSQAAQAQAQSQSQSGNVDLNYPTTLTPASLGVAVETSSQAAEQLKQLKDLEQRRLSEQQSELAGLKTREVQLERIVADNDQRSWSPHALDEKGIDVSPFLTYHLS